MKGKWRVLALSLILLLAGCGETVKNPILPEYKFRVGDVLTYRVKLGMDVSLAVAFFRYSGKVEFNGDMELRIVDTNDLGYKVQMDIKNPDVKGGNSQINTAIYIGLNSLRTYFSSFYMTSGCKITVSYGGNTYPQYAEFASAFFPDFSGLDKLYLKNETKTNFPIMVEKKDMTLEFKRNTKLTGSDERKFDFQNAITLSAYEPNDYIKSVEPKPNARLTFDLADTFDFKEGLLTAKKGKLVLLIDLTLTQGMLSYTVTVDGKGDFSLGLVSNTNLAVPIL